MESGPLAIEGLPAPSKRATTAFPSPTAPSKTLPPELQANVILLQADEGTDASECAFWT